MVVDIGADHEHGPFRWRRTAVATPASSALWNAGTTWFLMAAACEATASSCWSDASAATLPTRVTDGRTGRRSSTVTATLRRRRRCSAAIVAGTHGSTSSRYSHATASADGGASVTPSLQKKRSGGSFAHVARARRAHPSKLATTQLAAAATRNSLGAAR